MFLKGGLPLNLILLQNLLPGSSKCKCSSLSFYTGVEKKKKLAIRYCQSEIEVSKAGYEGQANQVLLSDDVVCDILIHDRETLL